MRSLPVLLLGFLLLAGCQQGEEPITREKKDRVNKMQRLVATIFLPEDKLHEGKVWVFKIVGPEIEIEPLLDPLDQFIRSVKFPDADNPAWELPQGWTAQIDKKPLRYATIYPNDKARPPELTVSVLEGELAGSIPDNVNRWRNQMGLKAFQPIDLEMYIRPEVIHGKPAYIVDMIGPGSRDKAAPIKPPPGKAPPPREPPFKYGTPKEWRAIPATHELYVLSFVAVEKEKKAAINVSLFPGDGGGVKDNANRWRKEVGLEPLDAAGAKALPEILIGTQKGTLIDADGPHGQRVIGAILLRERDALFVKMKGSSEFLKKQQPAFETFLKSISFGG